MVLSHRTARLTISHRSQPSFLSVPPSPTLHGHCLVPRWMIPGSKHYIWFNRIPRKHHFLQKRPADVICRLPAVILQFLPDSYLGKGYGNIYSCPNATANSSGWPLRGIQCSKIDLKLHYVVLSMHTPAVKAKKSHKNLILVTCFNSTCKLKRLHLTRPSLHRNHTYCQYIIIGNLKNHKF